jgi:hypothetical protein
MLKDVKQQDHAHAIAESPTKRSGFRSNPNSILDLVEHGRAAQIASEALVTSLAEMSNNDARTASYVQNRIAMETGQRATYDVCA